jgi:hypothetical protein
MMRFEVQHAIGSSRLALSRQVDRELAGDFELFSQAIKF